MKCPKKWNDRRTPESRRGVGHSDGRPVHRCYLSANHPTTHHACACGAQLAASPPREPRVPKLSDKQRDEIQSRYRAGEMTQKQLADAYGVSPRTISSIVPTGKRKAGKAWPAR